MFLELKNIIKNCYAPYSNFKVSACVVTRDNKKYFGVNVENSSYGASVCAERVSVLNAISMGEEKGNFKEIHIYSESLDYVMPCFLCRQTFVEFFDNDTLIYVYDKDGNSKCYTMDMICPLPFSMEN